MTRVFVARHAEPFKSYDLTHTNWPLSRFGRNQAEYLAGRLEEFAPLQIVSGPAVRCRETAEIIAQHFGKTVRIDPRLGEIAPPKDAKDVYGWLLENFSTKTVRRWGELDPVYAKWREDNVKALCDLKENSFVVTHFTNINAIMSSALHLDVTACCVPSYASLTEFSVINGNDVRLVMEGTEIKGPNE